MRNQHKHNHHGHGRNHNAGFGHDFTAGFGPGFGRGAGGFGPRGRRRASRGDIRSVILSLLSDAPSNGYGLIQAINERTAGAWRPSPGSVYPTLQQLVDEDLITATGDGRKTEYELTEAGRAHVAEHADELTSAWAATPTLSEAHVAMHESVRSLMGVVHQFRSAASDEQRLAAAKKLDETRKALYLILAD